MLVDSHCHLDFPDLAANLDEILANMQQYGVGHALCIGVNIESFPKVRALAEDHPNIYASVGVHPDYVDVIDPTIEELVELAAHPKVLAIGETGLDYFRLQGDLEWQRERFRRHIRAARTARKPLIIHTREAAADTLRIMAEENAAEVGGIMHCFTENLDVAEQALAMNFHISFSGIVTFKNAIQIKEVARAVPLERILVETDAPYLAPMPHRGKINQPAYVKHVAEEIARLKNISVEEVAQQTTRNFFKLFGLCLS
ncbi:MAG: TatD family hydrolase [Sulfuricellaceae bacterium]|nr:TatD family hydrolase [Sulfuricellaceae bacterium]